MSEERKTLTRSIIDEVWNRGDLDLVDELIDDGYVGHPSEVRGTEGYKQYFVQLRAAFPDIRFSIEDQIAEGDRVAVRWTATGTHQGDYAGIPPTGKRGVVTGMTTFHITDGKAVECWTNLDELGILRQLGVLPMPGQIE